MDAEDKTTARSRDYLDGIRGILMLGVLLLHVFYAATFTRGVMPWYRWTALWFQPVMYTVGLFVVLSGYCLMLPVARSPGGVIHGGARVYLARRARRILPPYYAALALSVLHLSLLPFQSAAYQIRPLGREPGVFWSHIFLFYNFHDTWRYRINGPYWSLAPEWQLYLLFPFVLVPVWRRTGLPGLLLFGVAGSLGLMLLGTNALNMHPWFLLLFTSGMAGAVIANPQTPAHAAWRDGVRWGLAAAILAGAFVLEWAAVLLFRPQMYSYLPPIWSQYFPNEMILGIAALAAILHWRQIQRTRPAREWPRLLRLLSHRWSTGLGTFSFSHYLVHFPIVISVASVVRSFHLSLGWTLLLTYLVAVPVSLSLAYLFFLGVENRLLPGRVRVTRVQAATAATAVPG